MDERCNTEEIQQSLVTRSIAQSSSRSSTASSTALKARAKAKAACMKASFAQKEAEMMVEEATVKAKMHILKKEKDAARATAEEAVFVAAVENAEIGSRHDIDLPLSPSNAAQWTSEYVLQHSCGTSELEVGKMIDSKMHRDSAVYDSASMQQRDIIVIILFFLGTQ